MNVFSILHVMGILSVFTGSMMFFPLGVAFLYNEGDAPAFLMSALVAILVGLPLAWGFHKSTHLSMKDGFIIVSLGWVLVCAFSSLPFLIHGSIPSLTDVFFEMMSGYTTTGATILTHIEALPHGLLFWRSFTHLLGGMGFIMILIILLPAISTEGMYLYKAEADPRQVITDEKFNPRLRGTAIRLWLIYLGFVLLNVLLLWGGGMALFDALCHSFGLISTAGYSPKNASLGHYENAYFDWVGIVFMFLGGINFILHYQFLKRDWQAIGINTELRWYASLTVCFCAVVSLILWQNQTYEDFSEALRYGTFQVVSLLTTTGFTTADYELWPQAAQMFLFIVLFVGASAGSTTSGIKMIHYAIIFKHLNATLKKLLNPLEVLPMRINRRAIDSRMLELALSYFIFNLIWVFLGAGMLVLLDDIAYRSALDAVIATLMNIGPSFGEVGPSQSYAHISDGGKWFLSLTMLTGRLEMFSVMVLFFPSFWKQ